MCSLLLFLAEVIQQVRIPTGPDWLHGKVRVGITAGAPEVLVQAVIDKLKTLGADSVRDVEGTRGAGYFSAAEGVGVVVPGIAGLGLGSKTTSMVFWLLTGRP